MQPTKTVTVTPLTEPGFKTLEDVNMESLKDLQEQWAEEAREPTIDFSLALMPLPGCTPITMGIFLDVLHCTVIRTGFAELLSTNMHPRDKIHMINALCTQFVKTIETDRIATLEAIEAGH